MKLRDHQASALSKLRAAYATGARRVCLVMPTASGKTVCAAEVMRAAIARGRKPLFFASRVELLDQCAATLRACGVPNVRVIQAENDNAEGDAIVASIPTMTTPRWLANLPDSDFVIWDECHGIKARTRMDLASKYARAFHLGLTATPARGDGLSLRDAFDALVVGATVAELTAAKLLVQCRVFAPSQIMDPRSLAMEPVDFYERHCASRRTIVFASTVAHAAKLADEFVARGIRAAYVSGEMAERSDLIASYAAGDLDVLVNVNILVEGWDDPPTSAAIFARRFTHPGPYLQAIGRTLRPFPGKTDSIVGDLCGSALVHGTPDLDREYSLSGKAIRGVDRQSIRQCPSCGGVSVARDACPFCAAEFPTATRALPQATGDGVQEIGAKAKPTSWPMRAKKRGLCASCGQNVNPGDWIMYSATRRTAMHTSCAAKVARARAEVAA